MNSLLASPQLWDLGAREQALALFDPRVVAAPVPDVTPSPDRNAFLQDVATVTRESVELVGATLH